MTDVRCTVDSCSYWGRGDVCLAGSIRVKNNMPMTWMMNCRRSHTEFARDLSASDEEREDPRPTTRTVAATSRETCCETMRPRSHDGERSKEQRSKPVR